MRLDLKLGMKTKEATAIEKKPEKLGYTLWGTIGEIYKFFILNIIGTLHLFYPVICICPHIKTLGEYVYTIFKKILFYIICRAVSERY